MDEKTLGTQIIELRSSGKTYREIASKLECSLATVSYHCGTGQKQKVKDRSRDRKSKKLAYVQQYKQSHSCVDCGENYPYWVLELDHLRDKVANISEMCNSKSFNLQSIVEELEKCEVVCANCHKNRTWTRLVATHGSTMDVSRYYT